MKHADYIGRGECAWDVEVVYHPVIACSFITLPKHEANGTVGESRVQHRVLRLIWSRK